MKILEKFMHKPISGTHVLEDADPISTSDILKALHESSKGKAFLFSIPSICLKPALHLAGGEKLVKQLLGNLEINSQGFQPDFNWELS